MKPLYTLSIALMLIACSEQPRRVVTPDTPAPYHFTYPELPATIPAEAHFDYMRDHFWDSYNFADTTLVHRADTTELLRAYALYVSTFVKGDPRYIADLMQRAAVEPRTFDHFVMLSEQILSDPNSPLRDNELYIPVLQAQLAAPHLDANHRVRPEYDLRKAMQNRVGHTAANLRYTLADGRTGNIHNLRYDHLLILFNTPGCPLCATLIREIEASPRLVTLQEQGKLKVLALYPDQDLEAWHAHAPQMPPHWLNAYAPDATADEHYDLRALPSLYLLDRHKTVLLRDAATIQAVEAILAVE